MQFLISKTSVFIKKTLYKKITLASTYLGTVLSTLGVKVRNMKMDFNTRGTWRRVEQ